MRQIVLSILVENTPGVLSRISGLFTRRGVSFWAFTSFTIAPISVVMLVRIPVTPREDTQ